jgi:hypothetical protein
LNLDCVNFFVFFPGLMRNYPCARKSSGRKSKRSVSCMLKKSIFRICLCPIHIILSPQVTTQKVENILNISGRKEKNQF